MEWNNSPGKSFQSFGKREIPIRIRLFNRTPTARQKLCNQLALLVGFLDLHNAVGSRAVQMLDNPAWPANLNIFDGTLGS